MADVNEWVEIGIDISEEDYTAINLAAEAERMTLNDFMVKMLRDYLKEKKDARKTKAPRKVRKPAKRKAVG